MIIELDAISISSYVHTLKSYSSLVGSSYPSKAFNGFLVLLVIALILLPSENTPSRALKITVYVSCLYTVLIVASLISTYLSCFLIKLFLSPVHDQPRNV